jgi:hypothetical protein
VVVELDPDRRGDPDRAAVTDVDLAADDLLGLERGEGPASGTVAPSAPVAVPAQV